MTPQLSTSFRRCLVALLLLWPLGLRAESVQLFTTDFPPYSFQTPGQVAGMATDMVRAVCQHAGVDISEIQVHPWARAFNEAQGGPNRLLFSIVKTEERAALFYWIGRIAPFRINLYKLSSREDIRLADLSDAKRYKTGAEFQDVKLHFLQKQGFEIHQHLELVRSGRLNLRKLLAGRVDLLLFDEASMTLMLKHEGYPPSTVEVALPLHELDYDLQIAASLGTAPELVERLQSSLRALEQTGTLERIRQRYQQRVAAAQQDASAPVTPTGEP